MIVITNFIAYIIPDMPRKLREQVHREAYLTNEIILKTELEILRGKDGVLSEDELKTIRRRAHTGFYDNAAETGELPEKNSTSKDLEGPESVV